MTNKETALILWGAVCDKNIPVEARAKVMEELQALRKKAKVSLSKLVGEENAEQRAINLFVVEQCSPKPRGEISNAIRLSLNLTHKSYAEIVEDVRKAFPSAVTTTRSIASIASDMRKRGMIVLDRKAS
jgi:CRISPR/Cas system-associated exonuclease Cas4 (RecB family)